MVRPLSVNSLFGASLRLKHCQMFYPPQFCCHGEIFQVTLFLGPVFLTKSGYHNGTPSQCKNTRCYITGASCNLKLTSAILYASTVTDCLSILTEDIQYKDKCTVCKFVTTRSKGNGFLLSQHWGIM
jgi:hypothetical protein